MIAKVEEEARSWKEECIKDNMKLGDIEKLMLEDTTTELQKRKKGKPTHTECVQVFMEMESNNM
jgi:hypothetical protein